jgi:hypothetical protein
LLGFLGVAANGHAANITYNLGVMVGTGSVTGTIVTDGTTGPLHVSNIVGWDLDVSDGTDPAAELTGTNSSFSSNGFPGLFATSETVYFDFFGPGAYQLSGAGFFLSFEGGIGSFSNANAGGWSVYDALGSAGLQYTPETGGVIAAIPEPSTAALWFCAAATIGLLRRLRAISAPK